MKDTVTPEISLILFEIIFLFKFALPNQLSFSSGPALFLLALKLFAVDLNLKDYSNVLYEKAKTTIDKTQKIMQAL